MTSTQTATGPDADRQRCTPRNAATVALLSTAILLLPAILLCGLFIAASAVLAIFGSFFEFGITTADSKFVGIDNYTRAAGDSVFWLAMRNNLIIVFGSIVLQVGFGAILAAILDRGIPKGSTVFRTIIFAPMVVSSVAVATIWLVILDPNMGVLNAAIKSVGLTPPTLGWLQIKFSRRA